MASTSSRLCVKNIPKRCDEVRLKKHFEAYGCDVTDVRVMRAKEGRSRQFGFVGFRTPEQAEAARQYFVDSFMDTLKLQVEIAKPMEDGTLARPWSRHSRCSSAHERVLAPETGTSADAVSAKGKRSRKHWEVGVGALLSDHPGKSGNNSCAAQGRVRSSSVAHASAGESLAEPKLEQFLQLMQPLSKQVRLWSDKDQNLIGVGDDPRLGGSSCSASPSRRSDMLRGLDSNCGGGEDVHSGNEGYYQEISAAPQFRAHSAAVKPATRWDQGLEDAERAKERLEGSSVGMNAEAAANESHSDMDAKPMSDLEYLRLKMASSLKKHDDYLGSEDGGVVLEGDKEEEGKGVEAETTAVLAPTPRIKAEGAPAAAALAKQVPKPLAEHGQLFVRNLPFTCSEEALQELFEAHGPLSQMHLHTDGHTGQGKGFAHVRFALGEHAVTALAALDGTVFQGRIVHVMEARPLLMLLTEGSNGDADKGGSFKRKRKVELKEEAGIGHNWNTLFMRSEAVGEAMAARYDLAKGEIFDAVGDGSLAVRLAEGEAYMLAQAKAFLGRHGVSLTALKRTATAEPMLGVATERSKTLLLVKNLDVRATQAELAALFGKHGQIGTVLLVPGNTLALVEFLEVGEARRAFRKLVYTKLHGAPLFLEWAPIEMFGKRQPGAVKGTRTVMPVAASGQAPTKTERVAAEEGGEGRTLFVKNLNFATKSEGLYDHFATRWAVRSANVVQKRDPKQPEKTLSMGYGFIEFHTAADAQQALSQMAGSRLDDHVLQLKFSSRPPQVACKPATTSFLGSAAVDVKPAKSNKLLVRNVPFEANKQELRELFSAFGQLKTLRLPKKFNGMHRGFAFVEFVSKEEAAKALQALSSTHLYGRKIVLAYAKPDVSVEALRLRSKNVDVGRANYSDANKSLEQCSKLYE